MRTFYITYVVVLAGLFGYLLYTGMEFIRPLLITLN